MLATGWAPSSTSTSSPGPARIAPDWNRVPLPYRAREVRWLERFEAGRRDRSDSGSPYWRARSVHELLINPDFDSLRDSPRYQALVGRLSR